MSRSNLNTQTIHTYRADPDLVRTKLHDLVDRAKQLNQKANCFTCIFDDLNQIELYCRKMRDTVLFGIVVAVKDCISAKGAALSYGLKPSVIKCSEHDAELLSRLRELGVFVIGTTNLDPLCLNFNGKNPYFGDAKNPDNEQQMVLGSSFGSALAVKLGLCDFALGSDMGGSLRAPAASLGLASLVGGLSSKGLKTLAQSFDNIGIIAQGLRDLVWIYNQISSATKATQIRAKKLLVPSNQELSVLSPAYRTVWDSLLLQLASSYQIVQSKQDLGFNEALEIRKTLITKEISDSLAALKLTNMPPEALAITRKSSSISSTELELANKKRSLLSKRIRDELLEDNLILAPVLPFELPPLPLERTLNRHALSSYLMLLNTTNLVGTSIQFEDKDRSLDIPVQLMGLAEQLPLIFNTILKISEL